MINPSLIKTEYEAAVLLFRPRCPSCGMLEGECYFLCPNSLNYYSAEREREDSLFEDSLPYSTWFSMAVRQYESVYGEGIYCS